MADKPLERYEYRRAGSALAAGQEAGLAAALAPPAPGTAPSPRRTGAPRSWSPALPGRWLSTSPLAWSQAIASPSAGGQHDVVQRARPCADAGPRSRAGRRPLPRSAPRGRRHRRAAPPRPAPAPPLRRRAGRSCSRPRSCGVPASADAPISSSTCSTSSRCASLSGCEMSRTWTMRSAEITSSSVARKAATSWVGRSEMKPTVSERIALSNPGSAISRIVGSSVANSRSSASTSARVSRLNRVDLPALV